MQRRVARSLAALGGALLILIPSAANAVIPSFASADAAVGLQVKPTFMSVTGACSGKIANSDGQTIDVLVEGTAQSEGPAAATEIACIVFQDPERDGTFDDTARCSAAMPLNAAACAEIKPQLPFAPFIVCAVATTHHLNGDEETGIGPNCPPEVG